MSGPFNRYGDVRTRDLPAVNVRNCGAALDGVSDDTEALYRAESKLPAYGGNIIVPWGSLRTTAPFVPQKPNIVITAGAARNAQQASVVGTQANGPGMIFADFAGPAIVLNSAYNVNGFGLSRITLCGQRGVGGRAIQFLKSTSDFRREFLLSDCTVTRFDVGLSSEVSGGYSGDLSWGVIRVLKSRITYNRWIARSFNNSQWQSFIFEKNDAGQNGYQVGEGGINLSAHNLSIVDNILEGQRDPIVLLNGAYRSVVIRNNYFESNVGTACIDIAFTYSVDIGPNFYATQATDYLVRLRHIGYGRCLDPASVTNGYHLDLRPTSNESHLAARVPASTTNPVTWATFDRPKTDRSWAATTSTTLTPNTAVILGGVSSSAYRQTVAVGGAGSVTQTASIAAASGQWVVAQFLFRKNSAHSADLRWQLRINGSPTNGLGSFESVANQSRQFLKRGEWVHAVVATRAHVAVTSCDVLFWPYGANPTNAADVTADVTRAEFSVVDNIGDIVSGVALPPAL